MSSTVDEPSHLLDIDLIQQDARLTASRRAGSVVV